MNNLGPTEAQLRALSATPKNGIDLTGTWVAAEKRAGGDVVSFVQLKQHGAAVFGAMQNKLAAIAPLQIRGVVIDGRLAANYWREGETGTGSGLIDLGYEANSGELTGTASWYDLASGAASKFDFHWRRA